MSQAVTVEAVRSSIRPPATAVERR
jgi:hypothetical protein